MSQTITPAIKVIETRYDTRYECTGCGQVWTGAFASAMVQDHTCPCTHESRTQTGVNGNGWECDNCGHIDPMTAEEFDWSRQDVPKCEICRHSAEFGGPLVEETRTFGSPSLVHATKCVR